MALTAKEREKIIEDETLRFETRQNLHTKACAGHTSRRRWLWWLGAGLLAIVLWCHFNCGGQSCSMGGAMGCKHAAGETCRHGQGKMMGKRCPAHGMGMGAEAAPESPEGPGTPKP